MLSVKLEASDEQVVKYLTDLWGSKIKKEPQTKEPQTKEPQTKESQNQHSSLIQTLLDNNIIGNEKLFENNETLNLEPANKESVNVEPIELKPANEEPANVEPANVESIELKPANEESVNVEPANVESIELIPANVEPVNVEPANVESIELIPANVEPANVEPVNVESIELTPVNTEPINVESIELTPVNTESYDANTNINQEGESVNLETVVTDKNIPELFDSKLDSSEKINCESILKPSSPKNKHPENDSEIIENFPEIVVDDKTKFKKQVKENLLKLREVGFRVYHNIGLEEEVNLVPNTVTNHDINKVYTFKTSEKLYRKNIMKDISKCTIFPKHKHGDVTKPENFRYLVNHHNTIKILDRLWCMELIQKIKDNIPDPEIFKASLIHRFNTSTSETAIKNTQSIDSVILLDIEKAFDSLEWDVLEDLMLSNLTRKINKETAKELVDQYMTILKNRELYYNNIKIEISKGISTGLPSSNLVFTLAMEEIIYRWFNKTKYTNNKEFILNVYVDDIYLKMLETSNSSTVVNSLTEFLSEFQLYVNKHKSKADPNLSIDIPNQLKPTDYYLGIPFTRSIKLYGDLILNEFQTKKLDWEWEDIYDELVKDNINKEVMENQRIIVGFMNYKLKPFLTDSEKTIKEQIKDFIFVNWVKEIKNQRNKMIILITTVLTVVSAVLISMY
jgi:hypothetical protein